MLTKEAMRAIEEETSSSQPLMVNNVSLDLALSENSENEMSKYRSPINISKERSLTSSRNVGRNNRAESGCRNTDAGFISGLPSLPLVESVDARKSDSIPIRTNESTKLPIKSLMDMIYSSISKNSSDYSGSSSNSSDSRSDVKADPRKIAVPEEVQRKDSPKPSGIIIHEMVVIKPKCSVASTSKLCPVEQTALSNKTEREIDGVPEEPPVNYELSNVEKSRISLVNKDGIPNQITVGNMLVQKGTTEVEADARKLTSIDRMKSSLKRSAAIMEGQASPDSGNETGSDDLESIDMGKIGRDEGPIFKASRKGSNENKFSSSSTTLKESRLQKPPEKMLRVEAGVTKDGTYIGEEHNSRKLNTKSNFSAQQPSQNRELKSICCKTARLEEKFLNPFGDDCDEKDCLLEQPKPVSRIAASELESTMMKPKPSKFKSTTTKPTPSKLESKIKEHKPTALFMTIFKEYHELFHTIQNRAKLIVELGEMLEQEQRTGDKHMQMALKEEILALGEELNSERSQKQQERLKYLGNKLNMLKTSIEENKR